MSKNKKSLSHQYKALLSHAVGGKAKDWKRVSKKTVMWGDIDRKFVNAALGKEVEISERADGLLFGLLPDGSKLTARLSAKGEFNAAAQPSTVDRVMNMLLDDEEAPPAIQQRIAKEQGLASRFSFRISDFRGKEHGEYGMFAAIYPTVRDSTFKTGYDYLRPLVPEGKPHDECVETEWHFPEEMDTPAKIAKYLVSEGFVLDKEAQKHQPKVLEEIEKLLNSPVEQLMRRVLAREYDVPDALLAQAVKEGLVKRFSFCLTSELAEDIGDGAKYSAFIYPTEDDLTLRCSKVIRAMAPGMKRVDTCGADEWHFPKSVKTLSDMKAYLDKRGFIFDAKEQKRIDAKVYKALKLDTGKGPKKPKL
jgi:hypothetical protein